MDNGHTRLRGGIEGGLLGKALKRCRERATRQNGRQRRAERAHGLGEISVPCLRYHSLVFHALEPSVYCEGWQRVKGMRVYRSHPQRIAGKTARRLIKV